MGERVAEIFIKHPGKSHVRTFGEFDMEPDDFILPGRQGCFIFPGNHGSIVIILVLAKFLRSTICLIDLDVLPRVVVDVVWVELGQVLDSTQRILATEPLGGVGQGDGDVLVVGDRQGDRLLRGSVTEELLLHGQHPVLHQQWPHCPLVLLSSVVNVLTFETMKIKIVLIIAAPQIFYLLSKH